MNIDIINVNQLILSYKIELTKKTDVEIIKLTNISMKNLSFKFDCF